MMSAWAELFEKLKGKYRILAICFPQFDKGAAIKPWGYDFNSLLSMLEKTIDSQADSTFPLIAHDWGAGRIQYVFNIPI
jgi:hypothetical protein